MAWRKSVLHNWLVKAKSSEMTVSSNSNDSLQSEFSEKEIGPREAKTVMNCHMCMSAVVLLQLMSVIEIIFECS